MLLSEYCKEIKPYVEQSLKQIKEQGYIVSYFNDIKYTNTVDFLDDCVLSICADIINNDLEKDVDFATALKYSGIVQGYLDNTNILGDVIKEQNPLKWLKK